MAEDAARELRNLALEDALELAHVYAEQNSPKYERGALRWLERSLAEGSPRLRHFSPRAPETVGERTSTPSAGARPLRSRRRIRHNVTTEEDIASVAEQLAELTRTVDAMARDLTAMTERVDRQQARADSQQDVVDSQQRRAQAQQERIDLAARELADVSDRLQAAANALRDSV